MLELDNIFVSFNKGTVDEMPLFENFNFSVKKGDFVSVVGSNGSGKTTLLNLICGSVLPDSGEVILNDKNITSLPEYKRAKMIGRVFQDPKMGTCSNLTVLENFALADNKNKAFSLTNAISKKRIDYYKSLLSQCNMGLEDRMSSKVGLLSGGQRQAIALIIACMTKVELLILDEHTAALDPKSSERIMELTDEMIKKNSMTAVMVTHNLRHAVNFGSRLIMMDKGSIVFDKEGENKKSLKIDDILDVFNKISIECGN